MTSQETDKITNFHDVYLESCRIHKALGWTKEQIREVIKARYGKSHRYQLSNEQLENYLSWLKSLPLEKK